MLGLSRVPLLSTLESSHLMVALSRNSIEWRTFERLSSYNLNDMHTVRQPRVVTAHQLEAMLAPFLQLLGIPIAFANINA